MYSEILWHFETEEHLVKVLVLGHGVHQLQQYYYEPE